MNESGGGIQEAYKKKEVEMKVITEKLYNEILSEVEEFVLLKQKKFFEENQEYFPLLVYDEKKLVSLRSKWKKIYYSESAGFCEEIFSPQNLAKYIDFEKVKDLLFERMSQVENCIALWRIVNEFVSEKLQQLSELVEVAKKQSKEYNEAKETNKIYSEFVRLKVAERL